MADFEYGHELDELDDDLEAPRRRFSGAGSRARQTPALAPELDSDDSSDESDDDDDDLGGSHDHCDGDGDGGEGTGIGRQLSGAGDDESGGRRKRWLRRQRRQRRASRASERSTTPSASSSASRRKRLSGGALGDSTVSISPKGASAKRCCQRHWEGLWAFGLLSVAVWMVVWRASWAVFANDADDFNWYIWDHTLSTWHDYYYEILVLSTISCVYALFLLGLVVAHVMLDVPLRMHWLHKIFVVLALLMSIAVTAALYIVWRDEMRLLPINLYFTAPFLHLALVVMITLGFWPVGSMAVSAVKENEARSWAPDATAVSVGGSPSAAYGASGLRSMKSRGRRWCADVCGRRSCRSMCVWAAVVLFFAWVYTIPLWVSSPCLGTSSLVASSALPSARGTDAPPAKPRIFAHRGAPTIAPENTMPSFDAAVRHGAYGLESDVQLSHDGEPFLMHDLTLLRTTNVEAVFPDRARNDANTFTWAELSKLEAGYSFAKHDPFRKAHTVPDSILRSYIGTPVPHLSDLLNVTRTTNRHLIFDLYQPPVDHPYHERYFDVVLDMVRAAHVDSQIFWLPGEQRQRVVAMAAEFTQVEGTSERSRPANDFLLDHIDVTNSRIPTLSFKQLKRYNDAGLQTLVWTVNSPWLFSLYWCGGYP